MRATQKTICFCTFEEVSSFKISKCKPSNIDTHPTAPIGPPRGACTKCPRPHTDPALAECTKYPTPPTNPSRAACIKYPTPFTGPPRAACTTHPTPPLANRALRALSALGPSTIHCAVRSLSTSRPPASHRPLRAPSILHTPASHRALCARSAPHSPKAHRALRALSDPGRMILIVGRGRRWATIKAILAQAKLGTNGVAGGWPVSLDGSCCVSVAITVDSHGGCAGRMGLIVGLVFFMRNRNHIKTSGAQGDGRSGG